MTAPTTDKKTKEEKNLRLCRIVGETKKLNGLMAYAPYSSKLANNSTCRKEVQVQAEGQPNKILVRYSNLVFLPTDVPTLEANIAVDRTNRGSTVTAFLAINDRFLLKRLPPGCGERSLGNLLAVQAHLAAHAWRNQGKRTKSGILLLCTDLNVSIAVNRVASATHQGDTTLAAACGGPLWEAIKQQIFSFKKTCRQRRNVFAVYRPPRLAADGYSRDTGTKKSRGKARVKAVLAGCFKIYPCAHAHYRDAMEVRYVAHNASNTVVRHETYLEYGPEEATAYVWNALALGDVDRLVPSTLAKVDPQAFWSAVLHIEQFRDVLHAGLSDYAGLCEDWNRVYVGVQASQVRWHMEASALVGEQLPLSVRQGTNTTDWGIQSPAEHERVAYACAHTALLVMLEAASFCETGFARNPVQVELMDCYQNLEIGRLVSALNALYRMEKHHTQKLGPLEERDHAHFLKQALEEGGYYGASRSSEDSLGVCGSCGASHGNDDKKVCGECHGVAYCNRFCQATHWKTHKKECNPTFALTKESDPIAALTQLAVRRLVQSKGVQLSSQPEETTVVRRPTQPSPDQVTGAGSISLVALPHHEGYLLSASGGTGTTVKFRHPLDLDPVTRFCLACGPLEDLVLAQACLNQALAVVGNDLSQLSMPHIHLTPLEWAAKSGNTIIAHWLCNDPRTKLLVHLGCPVGWACHSGSLQILRQLVHWGADPNKTGPSLSHLPPLLVAAEKGHKRPMTFLVGQCGVNIYTQSPQGLGILETIERKVPNWKLLSNYREAHNWAYLRIVNGYGPKVAAEQGVMYQPLLLMSD